VACFRDTLWPVGAKDLERRQHPHISRHYTRVPQKRVGSLLTRLKALSERRDDNTDTWLTPMAV